MSQEEEAPFWWDSVTKPLLPGICVGMSFKTRFLGPIWDVIRETFLIKMFIPPFWVVKRAVRCAAGGRLLPQVPQKKWLERDGIAGTWNWNSRFEIWKIWDDSEVIVANGCFKPHLSIYTYSYVYIYIYIYIVHIPLLQTPYIKLIKDHLSIWHCVPVAGVEEQEEAEGNKQRFMGSCHICMPGGLLNVVLATL